MPALLVGFNLTVFFEGKLGRSDAKKRGGVCFFPLDIYFL